MAIETYIKKSSQNITQGGMFEAHSNTIDLIVKDCAADDADLTLVTAWQVEQWLADAEQGDVYASVGSAFEWMSDGSNFGPWMPNTEFGPWRIRNITTRPSQDKGCWNVTIVQTNMGMIYNSEDANVVYGVASVSVNRVNRSRTVQAWRSSPTSWTETVGDQIDPGSSVGAGQIFANCPDDWQFCNKDQDISGIPMDINGGNAIPLQVGQEQITIEWIARSPYVDDQTAATVKNQPYEDLFWLQNLLNTRNAEQWFGFDPGYLLVNDVAIQPLHHEFKRCTMTLLYDKWKHATQRPWVTTSGVVATVNTCPDVDPSEGGLFNLTATVVGWLQPWQQLGSLGAEPSALFPINVWADTWLKFTGAAPDYAPVVPEGCE